MQVHLLPLICPLDVGTDLDQFAPENSTAILLWVQGFVGIKVPSLSASIEIYGAEFSKGPHVPESTSGTASPLLHAPIGSNSPAP